ncbi:hypothetical protein PHYBOEH_002750 [Phytophthora boehmeriae]|uniref:Uncharacterized protein n=1 Tax=Phytophthora boehmeriae TaxID=109152 RepID=A0A8T1WRS9_9STRA|nr:hypothetical protein PHYBOEH_002750 [Phytophthora boehmeriae]
MSTGNVRGNTGQQSSDPPFVAVFTSLLEFTAHQLGSKNGICLRMNRMSLRTFAAEKYATPFSITITASLLQATSSAGGAGAAAAVSNAVEAESTFIVREEQSSEPREVADGHTFVFIVKSGEKLQEHGVTLPPQWFTSLNAASEKKTIVIESSSTDPVLTASDDKVESRPENFHIFIFTIHGLTIELSCSATTPVQEDYAQEENDTAPQLFIDTRKSESFKAGPATVYVEDGETIEFAKSFSGKPATSADLLRELLLHQKKRQLETSVEPPPDFLAGTSVSVSKPTTTAETLRAKILQSRQLERRARLQQLESDLQCKLNRTRQKSTSDAQRPESADTNAVTPHSPKSELESKVSVLATFFHEMAMHQPRRDELHTCVEEAEAEDVAEQQLLKHFGDMFDLDEDLQNTLDEEKWSTNTAKVTRRKASISTNLPKPMPDNTRRSGKQADSDEPQWTSEDYESTAQYIEQLMLDVANDEVQQQQQQTLADIERKNAVMEQLIDSWGYMQHRTATPASNQRLHELEQKRRNQWMQSERVKEYDTAASARRGDKSERAAIIFSKQRFLVQEQSIPSSAVWVVPTPPSNQTSSLASGALAAAGLITPSRPESPHLDGQAESSVKIRPRRPTQQAVIVTPPPPEERESDVTALRSAAILRARVRRIRSAHSHQKVSVTASQHSRRVTSAAISPKNAMKSENSRSVKKSVVLEIPASLLNHATQSLVYEISVDNQTSDTFLLDDDVPEDNDEVASLNISPLESAVLGTCKILGNPAAAGDEDDESNNIKGAARKKRKKKKRCAPLNVVRFRRSLMELASLPSKLQAAADDERMQNERLEELNSASFVFPSRSIKPKPNLRPQVDP